MVLGAELGLLDFFLINLSQLAMASQVKNLGMSFPSFCFFPLLSLTCIIILLVQVDVLSLCREIGRPGDTGWTSVIFFCLCQ